MAKRGSARSVRGYIFLVVWALWPFAVAAGPCDAPAPIRFASGTSSAEITGGVPRGERDCLQLRARAGQHMTATVESPEKNVVFQIYRPRWKVSRSEDAFVFDGEALQGTAETADASSWSGRLPESGSYLFVLGTTRGGGEYRLHVIVR